MKTFLAVYLGTANSPQRKEWDSLSEGERKAREEAGMKAWMAWGGKYSAAVVEHGGPLGKTKHISARGIADVTNNLAGYTVVKAESHEAAARMFEKHPHFSIFPGESVEIMEILPIPGQP
jgi:hypothetical protein